MEHSAIVKIATTMGIDLAKNVFQVHGVDARGKAVLQKQLKRAQVLTFFSNRTPCLIGMEACGGAHYWARELVKLGHTVKLMAPQFVKPYVKTNKNDARVAEGICEAVSRPSMRFVAVKTPEQQALLSVHRARQGFVDARTATANQIRGLLAEFGFVAHAARETAPSEHRHRGAGQQKRPDCLGNVGPSRTQVPGRLHTARRRRVSDRDFRLQRN